MPDKTIPTYGYHPRHGAKLFELPEGAKLPVGYSDEPFAGQHPHDVERGVKLDADDKGAK